MKTITYKSMYHVPIIILPPLPHICPVLSHGVIAIFILWSETLNSGLQIFHSSAFKVDINLLWANDRF